ncbi:MAG: hypothetical protein JFR38_08770 [Muribaculaceae bacterium]|nr:hypothetical protein [Muribaculaceae bacterium]
MNDSSEEKKTGWGGARAGAGRKRKERGKYYGFTSTPEVEAIIEARAAQDGFSRTDFICAAIVAYDNAQRGTD